MLLTAQLSFKISKFLFKMGDISIAINFCDSEVLCWLSIAYDFLLYFNTEIKHKTLNMIQCSTCPGYQIQQWQAAYCSCNPGSLPAALL